MRNEIFYFFFDSMESGFGSDIFDANGTDLSRQSSTFERVRMSIVSNILLKNFFFKAFSERSSNIDEDPMLDNTGIFLKKIQFS
jgi:hypothetical protein